MNILKGKLNKIKILIIGSGIIGKFNALELSSFGFDITLVDQDETSNSSNAALGILMGKIYQKRKGRSWKLRQKSLELWPKWLNLLRKYNSKLYINKPLIQLTTDNKRFNKLIEFVNNYPQDNFEIVNENSNILAQVKEVFQGNILNGIISHQDGRIDPRILLTTLNMCIKQRKIRIINDEIVKVKKINNQWFSTLKNGKNLTSDVVILCNSMDSMKLISPEIFGIKLKPVLGQAIEIYSDDNNINFLSLPKHLNINGKNLIPLTQQRIIIGSTDEYRYKPEEECIDELLEFLNEKPDWLNKSKISRKWFGIRSRPDGEGSPLLKSLDKGLILCSGFYKNGILLAPACSKWISEEITKHL